MLFLIVSDVGDERDYITSALREFSDNDSFQFVNSVESAKNFISDELLTRGGYVDYIITSRVVASEQDGGAKLLSWIRDRSYECYCNGSLFLKKVPFSIFSMPKDDHPEEIYLDREFGEISTSLPENIGVIVTYTVKNWLSDLLNDYDLLSIDPRSPSSVATVWNSRCLVLSRKYAMRPYRFRFITFVEDIYKADWEIKLFSDKIQEFSPLDGKQQEKEIHKLLMSMPRFFLGELYDKYFYEEKFPYVAGGIEGEEPDFVLRDRYYNFNRRAKVFEVKLRRHKFVSYRGGFHSKFHHNLFDNLNQVVDYRRYFSDPRHVDFIVDKLKFFPHGMKYEILMGTYENKMRHAEVLERRMEDFNLTGIALTTYEELIERRRKLLVYRKLYNIA